MEWSLLQEIYRLRGRAAQVIHTEPPPIRTIQDEFEMPANNVGQWMYLVANYNPLNISTPHYLRRNVYYHPRVLDDLFAEFESHGLLKSTGTHDKIDGKYLDGEEYASQSPLYHASEKGRKLYDRIGELLRPRWSLPHAEGDEIDRVILLLTTVATAIQNAPTPPEHWAVDTRNQYGWKLPSDIPPFERLNYLIFDLWAYRDDTHLAAWSTAYPDLSPRTWEAFTYVWQGDATDAETLEKTLEEHGFSANAYKNSLNILAQQGWIENSDHGYGVTELGNTIRQDIEDMTDSYFYKPWQIAFSEDERAELQTLLGKVKGKLEAIITP